MQRKLLWPVVILSSMAIAQHLVKIQAPALDVAATGVYLASLDDIGHSATVKTGFYSTQSRLPVSDWEC